MATLQRLRWLFTEHPIYFITACSYNRCRILDQPAVHDSLIQFGLRACQHRVWVGHYVIMPITKNSTEGYARRNLLPKRKKAQSRYTENTAGGKLMHL